MEQFSKLAFALMLLVGLSACAPLESAVNPYEESFKCKAGDDTGKCVDTPTAYRESRYPQVPLEPGMPTPGLNPYDQRYQMIAGLMEEPQKPILQPAKILRVLLLPYEGEGNELFMTRYAYIKVEDSDWILSDINETVK